jgi:hypothetical protein
VQQEFVQSAFLKSQFMFWFAFQYSYLILWIFDPNFLEGGGGGQENIKYNFEFLKSQTFYHT